MIYNLLEGNYMNLFLRKDKRRYPRIRPGKDLPIRVDINGENFMDILFANDICESGVGIFVPHEFRGCSLEKAVSLVVALPLPVKGYVTLPGKICHISDKIFGVTFEGPPRKERRLIQDYISCKIKDEPWITILKYRLGVV